MPLHLTYRPSDFDQVIGNETTIKSIETIFKRKSDWPHTWLFIGKTGCGKTTLARIVSRYLGCEPVASNQDFQEINASNSRGIDTAREIQRNMGYLPVTKGSKCRVYLLEEVHSTTRDAQNALLRALEDTPSHVYFLLCTTEPEKLLPTIRNRCSTFEVKPLNNDQMEALINHVLEEEGEDGVSEDVIKTITEVADGCPRQALVTLDQIIDLDPKEMLAAVQSFQASQKQTIDLCRALLNGTWKDVQGVLKDLKEDPEKIRQAVNHYMQAVLLRNPQIDSQALLVLTCFENNFFYNGRPGLVKACADVFS